jgi:hypothetical protein
LIDRLLSKEPKITPVHKLKLVFIPDTCYKVQRFWHVPIVAWVYDDVTDVDYHPPSISTREKEKKDITKLFPPEDREIIIASCDTELKRQRLESSLRPFLVNSLRGKKLRLQIDKQGGHLHRKSTWKGGFSEHIPFTKEEIVNAIEDEDVLVFRGSAQNHDMVDSSFFGYSIIPDRKGLSIISGVEGTLRDCNPLDRANLLTSTFLTEYQPVRGMMEFLKHLRTEFHASFHWVSSAPMQLYEDLAQFFSSHGAPRGSYHLHSFNKPRDHELHLRFRLFETNDPNYGSKLDKMDYIIYKYPKRRFILLGNSAEHDPEMYGELFRRYPDQIQKILIRDSAAHMDDALIEMANSKEAFRGSTVRFNNENRFQEAFHRVPRDKWIIFNDPSEIKLEYLDEHNT